MTSGKSVWSCVLHDHTFYYWGKVELVWSLLPGVQILSLILSCSKKNLNLRGYAPIWKLDCRLQEFKLQPDEFIYNSYHMSAVRVSLIKDVRQWPEQLNEKLYTCTFWSYCNEPPRDNICIDWKTHNSWILRLMIRTVWVYSIGMD